MAARRAHERAVALFVVERAAERALGAVLAQHAVLLAVSAARHSSSVLFTAKRVGVRTGADRLRTAEPRCDRRKSKDCPDDSEELAAALHSEG